MKNYYQTTGRPHAGLSNPAKFGLTHEEVVILIDSGEWRDFYLKWRNDRKKEKRITTLRYVCPTCERRIPDIDDWTFHANQCKECGRQQSTNALKKRKKKNTLSERCALCTRYVKKPGEVCLECKQVLSFMRAETKNHENRA